MTLDPGADRLIALVRSTARPPVEELSVGVARESIRAATPLLNGPSPELASVRGLIISGKGGPIPLRLYEPETTTRQDAAPALVFLHGGGWVLGDLDTHDVLCRQLALAGVCKVISVDYRRAPEHRFPAALNDAATALAWISEHAPELRVDCARIGVAGDSAGGNLAAVLAVMARDGELPPVAFQALLYPVCDLRMGSRSYETNGEGYLLTRRTMGYFIASYLSRADQAQAWKASPGLTPSLHGVAPALVLTAGYDPLCDEGCDYARRLAAEGVSVEHLHLAGQVHGFLTAGAVVTEAAQALEAIGRFIRALFSRDDLGARRPPRASLGC